MKENIHPKYFKTTATCACGANYEIGSTQENIRVDICSKCHPLFTGTMKLLDTEGRVDKFKKKYEQAKEREKAKVVASDKQKKANEEAAKRSAYEKVSVMEKLQEIRKGKTRKETPQIPAPAAPKAAPKPKAKPVKAASPAKKKAAKKSK